MSLLCDLQNGDPAFLWVTINSMSGARKIRQQLLVICSYLDLIGLPFQCSCLENPRDRGAWWAAVYGVAQSRTRLKRLSSSRLNWADTTLDLKQWFSKCGSWTSTISITWKLIKMQGAPTLTD